MMTEQAAWKRQEKERRVKEKAEYAEKLAEWKRISEAETDPRLERTISRCNQNIEWNPRSVHCVRDALEDLSNAKLNFEDRALLAARAAKGELVEVEEWGLALYYHPSHRVTICNTTSTAASYYERMWTEHLNEVLFVGLASTDCQDCKKLYEQKKAGFDKWFCQIKTYSSRRYSFDANERRRADYKGERPQRIHIFHVVGPDETVWHATSSDASLCGKWGVFVFLN